jgi:hypothetical protein
MNYTVTELKNIIAEATQAARNEAADAYERNGNTDWDACGFAWVSIWGVKGNTRLGKALKAAGIEQSYDRSYQIWGGKFYSGQSVTIKEAACSAARDVFKRYGFEATVGSRLD